LGNLTLVTGTVEGRLPELDYALAHLGEAAEGVFRAGNRGEILNQKILCVFVGPPTSSEAGCPTGDPIKGLSSGEATPAGPVTGAAGLRSLLTQAVGA